jgi:hypothetical protein
MVDFATAASQNGFSATSFTFYKKTNFISENDKKH